MFAIFTEAKIWKSSNSSIMDATSPVFGRIIRQDDCFFLQLSILQTYVSFDEIQIANCTSDVFQGMHKDACFDFVSLTFRSFPVIKINIRATEWSTCTPPPLSLFELLIISFRPTFVSRSTTYKNSYSRGGGEALTRSLHFTCSITFSDRREIRQSEETSTVLGSGKHCLALIILYAVSQCRRVWDVYWDRERRISGDTLINLNHAGYESSLCLMRIDKSVLSLDLISLIARSMYLEMFHNKDHIQVIEDPPSQKTYISANPSPANPDCRRVWNTLRTVWTTACRISMNPLGLKITKNFGRFSLSVPLFVIPYSSPQFHQPDRYIINFNDPLLLASISSWSSLKTQPLSTPFPNGPSDPSRPYRQPIR